jgi:hypothetical protein
MSRWPPNRRTLIAAFALCASTRLFSNLQTLLSLPSAHAEQADILRTPVKIVVPAVDEARVRDIIASSGGQASPGSTRYEPPPGERQNTTDPNFSPLVILIVALTASYLATTIFRLWSDIKFGGVVVDARGSELLIKEDHAIPRGTVIVVGAEKDKVQEFTPKDETELGNILKSAIVR